MTVPILKLIILILKLIHHYLKIEKSGSVEFIFGERIKLWAYHKSIFGFVEFYRNSQSLNILGMGCVSYTAGQYFLNITFLRTFS